MNIKESKVPELEIKCPCSYEESLPLKDYLNVTEKRNKLSYVFGIKKEEIVKKEIDLEYITKYQNQQISY